MFTFRIFNYIFYIWNILKAQVIWRVTHEQVNNNYMNLLSVAPNGLLHPHFIRYNLYHSKIFIFFWNWWILSARKTTPLRTFDDILYEQPFLLRYRSWQNASSSYFVKSHIEIVFILGWNSMRPPDITVSWKYWSKAKKSASSRGRLCKKIIEKKSRTERGDKAQ